MKKTTFIFLAVVVLFSCKKDPKNDPQSCTISTASISGPYKITAVTYKANATAAEQDFFNTLFVDACRRDDVYTFKEDGTYKLTDAGTVCSPSGDDNGTWTLSGTATMQIDGDDAAIESFDCKKLILVNTDIDLPGDKMKITMTRQ